MTTKRIGLLLGLILLLFALQWQVRKKFGEFYPGLFMPSFPAHEVNTNEVMHLKELYFEAEFPEGQRQKFSPRDVFRIAPDSNDGALTRHFSPPRPHESEKSPSRSRRLLRSVFPGYARFYRHWSQDAEVEQEIAGWLISRVRQMDAEGREPILVDAVWEDVMYAPQGGDMEVTRRESSRHAFAKADHRE